MKYILVTGGILSGLGKGVIASSTGRMLRSHGFKVTLIKIDPYLNIDAGTMSPFEHGEVFITSDGGETDLDTGNYERFVDLELTRDNNITTGKIYRAVIEKARLQLCRLHVGLDAHPRPQERRGEYLGKTVQVVPHICDEIQEWVARVAKISADGTGEEPDVCVIELGGTIGDIESAPFVEAMRQFQFKVGRENFCLMHVSLVPVLGVVGEQKTKPTQQSVRDLRSLGLSPDMILCRSSSELVAATKQKISSFCHVAPEAVIGVHDVSNIYRVPQLLLSQGVLTNLVHTLKLSAPVDKTFVAWNAIADKLDRLKLEAKTDASKAVHIAFVGKYTGLQDSYISVIRALEHASFVVNRLLVVDWIEATDLESASEPKHEESWELLKKADGILVPGGFGDRGAAGKILAAKYAREQKKPFLGICLGLQIAVIEHAQSLLGWKDATSEEFNASAEHKVVVFMPEIDKTHMGGTMRLGARRTLFKTEDCVSYKLYKKLWPSAEPKHIMERHRHRYEVNPALIEPLSKTGLHFVGQDDSGTRQEIIERKDHPYYVAVQYHPEMKSRPTNASPPFVGLLLAASNQLQAFLADA